jgi:hypothetical protein
VVSTTPRPLYPRERPGTHCTGGWVGPRVGLDVCKKISPPTGIRFPDRPARNQSLNRLSYPAHPQQSNTFKTWYATPLSTPNHVPIKKNIYRIYMIWSRYQQFTVCNTDLIQTLPAWRPPCSLQIKLGFTIFCEQKFKSKMEIIFCSTIQALTFHFTDNHQHTKK